MRTIIKTKAGDYDLRQMTESDAQDFGLSGIEWEIVQARVVGKPLREMMPEAAKLLTEYGAAFLGLELDPNPQAVIAMEDFLTTTKFGDWTLREMKLALTLSCRKDVKLTNGEPLPNISHNGKYFGVSFLATCGAILATFGTLLDSRIKNKILAP